MNEQRIAVQTEAPTALATKVSLLFVVATGSLVVFTVAAAALITIFVPPKTASTNPATTSVNTNAPDRVLQTQ